MKNIVKYLKNHTGSTLMLTLITLAVSAILGMVLLSVSASHLKMTTSERDYQAVYYIAEAGLNQRLSELKEEITKIYGETTSEIDFFQQFDNYINIPVDPVDSFDSVNGQQPIARVEIDKSDTKYTIKSTGEIGNRQRTVIRVIELTWIPENSGGSILNDMAAFVNSTIKLTNHFTVIGDIGSNSSASDAIYLDNSGSSKIEGNIYYIENRGAVKIDKASTLTGNVEEGSKRQYTLPPFPMYPLDYSKIETKPHEEKFVSVWNSSREVINQEGDLTHDEAAKVGGYVLNLDKNYQLRNVSVVGNTTLKIDVGNVNRSIVVDHLHIQSGNIQLLGTGKLTVYAKKVSIGSGTVNKGSNPYEDSKRLNIYIKGTEPAVEFNLGSGEIHGSVYAENANIILERGKKLYGSLVTGGTSVKIRGGSTASAQLLYAPNADVEVSGGAYVEGTMICESLHVKGNSTLKFTELSLDGLPFFPDDGSWGSGGGTGGGGASPSLEDLLNIGSTREL